MNVADAPKLFQPYLFPGERISWSGRPRQGIMFAPGDTLLVPFSLMWGGFAIFWNAMVWFGPFGDAAGGGPDIFFRLWGLPFLMIGLYLIAGRFFHDAHLRRKIYYAVTDQRILILRGAKFTALDIDRLPRLALTEHRDTTGTIDFEAGNGPLSGMNGFGSWVPALGGTARFFRIDDPRRVYRLVRDPAHR